MALGRLRQRNVLKCMPHVQHNYFCSQISTLLDLMNMSKLSSYSDLLTHVDLGTLEFRKCSHALTLFCNCMYIMGPINIKEMFVFRNDEYDPRGLNKLYQPAYNCRFMHRSYLYMTSRLWNNLPDCVS